METISDHVNSSLYWLIIINFFGNFICITCIYLLRNIKHQFNIKNEMILGFLTWFVCTQATLGGFIYEPGKSQNWIYLVLVIRSFLTAIFIAARPLYLTYKKEEKYIMVPPNSESIDSVDMALQIPIATDYFYFYLEEYGSLEDPDILYFFSLYADITKFDKYFSKGYEARLLYALAMKIKNDYLNPESRRYHIKMRAEVYTVTMEKLEDFERAV